MEDNPEPTREQGRFSGQREISGVWKSGLGPWGGKVLEMRRAMIVLSLLVLAMPVRGDGAAGLDDVQQMVSLSREGAPDEAAMVSGRRETLARATLDEEEGTKMPPVYQQGGLDEGTVISCLKETLSVATGNAVTEVAKVDGYFGNQAIKILLPERLQKVADLVNLLGFRNEVDAFVLSMNRAAEHAAPKAEPYFVQAVKDMTFLDARKILNGGDTAATEYLNAKTYDKLYEAFKPEVSASMNEVGVTRSYQAMMEKYQSVPLMKAEPLDLDQYVTQKSLDGLFTMIGQEEKEIRTNPAARVTALLKKVFRKPGQ
jgi:RNA binding exosome subunit